VFTFSDLRFLSNPGLEPNCELSRSVDPARNNLRHDSEPAPVASKLATPETTRWISDESLMTGHKTDPKWNGFLSKVDGPVVGKPFAPADLLSTIQTVLTENALKRPKPS
jgi:hypothetical protein